MTALTDTFVGSLRACGGGVSSTSTTGLVEELVAVVGPEARVVLTPELASLAADLTTRVATADVGASTVGESLEDTLRTATASVTRGLAGVARSGTVLVGPGGGNGGLLAALPPLHVVVLDERDIVESLVEAVAVVAGRFDELGGEAVFITGPSRTADIEMMSVVGVHGPLALHVVITRGGEA